MELHRRAAVQAAESLKMLILAFSGSLRRASSNTAVLQAAAALAPAGVRVVLYEGLGGLPHFNPDLNAAGIREVEELRAQVKAADGLLFSTPEYAHGVPGSLKNALDWLVGCDAFIEKWVALINTSPRATVAQASLADTLRTMSSKIVAEASVTLPLLGKKLDAAAIVGDAEMSGVLRRALDALRSAIEAK